MDRAMDDVGFVFSGSNMSDVITAELHAAANYGSIVYTATNVPVSINGDAAVLVPSIYSASYYITVKRRNSLQTVSSVAKSFAGSSIIQSVGTPADIHGGNLLQMIELGYAIFGGDVNQDDIIDSADRIPVENDPAAASSG